MEKKVSIIGGDARIVHLVKMLQKEGYSISTYALEKAEDINDIPQKASLQEAMQNFDFIITSIPLSKDGIVLNTPLSDTKITVAEFYEQAKGKKIISGKLEASLKEEQWYDLLEMEEYAVLNAIATAEGAIQIAMEEFPKTLLGAQVLVMGFGRIGKVVAKMLQGIGANVFCEARKKSDLAYIQAFGYTPISLEKLEENLPQFDIIINNIPVKILQEKQLNLVKKDVLIIDLASNPGGVDFEYAKKQNIKTIWALALPGKVAPVSVAEYIKETIDSIV